MLIYNYIVFTIISIFLVNIGHNLVVYIQNSRKNRNITVDLKWKGRWIVYSTIPYVNVFICIFLVLKINKLLIEMKEGRL